ncbi:hypothetical protein Cantr_01431 [Candida viswanathii]|uniref:Uncharacterized protein n=1 Tax=Candida viswanathii TaxID=5486 RepID=A0A367YI16_9ASCO|nr:hypothetical protein Cantr_01431 [Candida viswanathii]
MAGLFNRRRRSDSYQGFSKYAYEINAYHNPTQQHGLPIQLQTPQRTASMTSAGQAAAAALRMHSTPVKQQQQQQQSHARPQQPTAQRYYTARSNSLTTGRSNSLRLYTYNPKPSYSVGNPNGRSYSLSSRNSFTGRPGVTSPLQHEYIHEEGIAGDEEDEEEEVITTKTTRVVDSAGRTTSITTKTIRTLPDGSNIIETTTKNISRPSSRLNSLSSGGNTHRAAGAAAAAAGADGNLDMIEEFENFEYSRSELDTELAGTEKLKLNTEDVPASPKQLGAAFSPTQHYERTTSLNSIGKPRSILKNSGGSIKLSQPEPVVANGTAHAHPHPPHDSPPSSIRFNPKVQTRQYSPKETQVKVKKEKLTDEELYAAAYRAANKKVFGDGANVVEPPAPAPQSPEPAKKSKYTFIPLTRKEPVQPTTPSPTIEQKPAVAAPVPVAAPAPAPATTAAPTTETPRSPNYLLSMRDQPQRQTSRKERAKEEKRQAKIRAKEAEEEERRRAKEDAEEEKRRAKEEAKLAKQQAEDEKKRLKEEAKLAKEQEKASKKKNNFLDKFISSRRRSSASSYSGTAIENRASVENGGVAPAAVAVPAAVVTGTAATVSAATPTVQAPTVQASVQAPSVQAATFKAPTVQASSVQPASVQAPTFKVPVVQAPSVQAPSVQAPSVQAPSVQAPVVDKPSAAAVETATGPATSVPQPNLEDGVHDHTEGSKTVKGHGKFFSITDAANGNGHLKESSQPEVGVPNGNLTAQAPVQKTIPAQATTVAKDTLPTSSTAPTHLAGIPINSPIYYAADEEANGSSAPAPVSAPKHVADEDSVVKVAVPVLKSRTPSLNNVITGETPIPHVPVPHLQLLDDVTVDVEPETIDDESLEETDAIDVIDDYRSSLEQRAEVPAVNGSAAAIKAPAQPFANGNVTTPAKPQTPSQDLPAPNVSSTSTGNTPQITAVPVMGAAAINTQKTDPVPQPQLDTLPDPNVASEDTEELVVEKKEKGTKRQRFLKFFVL